MSSGMGRVHSPQAPPPSGSLPRPGLYRRGGKWKEASGLATGYNAARREDDRPSGYGGLGEGGGVAGARSPERRGRGGTPRAYACAHAAGGAGAGPRGEVAAAVAAVSLSSWRGRCVVACVVAGKVRGVACVGPARPRSSRVADLGEPALAGSWPHLRSEPEARAGRPGCARVARATRVAGCRFPARRRVDASPPRPRSSTGRGLRGRACRARPGPGLAKPAR